MDDLKSPHKKQGRGRIPRNLRPNPSCALIDLVHGEDDEEDDDYLHEPPATTDTDVPADPNARDLYDAMFEDEEDVDIAADAPGANTNGNGRTLATFPDVPKWESDPNKNDDDDADLSAHSSPRVLDFVGSAFQARLDTPSDGIFIPEWVLAVTSNGTERLVLAQLAYWFGETRAGRVRAKIKRGGYHWVAKTYAELGREVHVTGRQARWAVDKLAERNLVVREDRRFRGLRTTHLRLSVEDIDAAYELANQEVEEDGTDDML